MASSSSHAARHAIMLMSATGRSIRHRTATNEATLVGGVVGVARWRRRSGGGRSRRWGRCRRRSPRQEDTAATPAPPCRRQATRAEIEALRADVGQSRRRSPRACADAAAGTPPGDAEMRSPPVPASCRCAYYFRPCPLRPFHTIASDVRLAAKLLDCLCAATFARCGR